MVHQRCKCEARPGSNSCCIFFLLLKHSSWGSRLAWSTCSCCAVSTWMGLNSCPVLTAQVMESRLLLLQHLRKVGGRNQPWLPTSLACD